MKMTYSTFKCPECGQTAMTLPRRVGRERPKGHRKWIYCPWCQKKTNTYECRNDSELFDFRVKYESGEITKLYEQECKINPPRT